MTDLHNDAELLVIERATRELDLGVSSVAEMTVRMPFCATSRMPFCSLKPNAEGAKLLLGI
jgi:hypothetical protein